MLVAELLERVNLTFAAKRKVKGYSGGMRQRLGIAQAIAGNPRLIIVDEPTAGLDPEERLRFRNFVNDIADEIPVLLSTHIVEDVSVLCSRFAVIRKGEIVAVMVDGSATVKRYYREGDKLRLAPSNPEMEDIINVEWTMHK